MMIAMYTSFFTALDRVCRDLWARVNPERGAAMAEYGLLLVLIGFAAIGALALIGGEIFDLFAEADDKIWTSRQSATRPN